MTNRNIVIAAASKVGGVVALSEKLGLSRGAVSQWQRVPVERVLDVEKLTGFSRYILRPDIYGLRPDSHEDRRKQDAA